MMTWYYQQRADPSVRGEADHKGLRKMLRSGRLHPTDLVWSVATRQRWLPAVAVRGLVPGRQRRRHMRALRKAAARPRHLDARAIHRHGIQTRLLMATVCLLTLALFVLLGVAAVARRASETALQLQLDMQEYSARRSQIREELRGAERALLQEDLELAAYYLARVQAYPEARNSAARLQRRLAVTEKRLQVEEVLSGENLDAAEVMIAQLAAMEGSEGHWRSYSNRLEVLRGRLAETDWLEEKMMSTLFKPEEARRLVDLYRAADAVWELVHRLRQAEAGLHADEWKWEQLLNFTRVARLSAENELTQRLLRRFIANPTLEIPVHAFLDLMRYLQEAGMGEAACALLERYAQQHQERSDVWYQLALLRLQHAGEREAIRALRNAVRYGGDPVRLQAANDDRWLSIRDAWSFRRLIRLN